MGIPQLLSTRAADITEPVRLELPSGPAMDPWLAHAQKEDVVRAARALFDFAAALDESWARELFASLPPKRKRGAPAKEKGEPRRAHSPESDQVLLDAYDYRSDQEPKLSKTATVEEVAQRAYDYQRRHKDSTSPDSPPHHFGQSVQAIHRRLWELLKERDKQRRETAEREQRLRQATLDFLASFKRAGVELPQSILGGEMADAPGDTEK